MLNHGVDASDKKIQLNPSAQDHGPVAKVSLDVRGYLLDQEVCLLKEPKPLQVVSNA